MGAMQNLIRSLENLAYGTGTVFQPQESKSGRAILIMVPGQTDYPVFVDGLLEEMETGTISGEDAAEKVERLYRMR